MDTELKQDNLQKKNSIFISHATPSDNEFTKWLSLKLISFGYTVWCDILFLDKGVDFWKNIENEIRTKTCRFLVVLSEISNKSEGVLKEISVAEKVKKELNDDGFIIPLLIDDKLSYDDINIHLNRLNAIDFKNSWASGLHELTASFTRNNIPKSIDNYNASSEIYNNIFSKDKNIIIKDETYNSSWFPILSLPEYLYFHSIDINNFSHVKENIPFSFFEYKNHVCTFSEDIGSIFPNLELFEKSKKIAVPTSKILNRSYDTDFARNFECKKFMIRLLNNGFKRMMTNKNLRAYHLSNFKTGYWFEINQLEKNKFNKTLFVGKTKNYNWHFCISGLIKLIPFPILVLTSHIIFTEDGKNIIKSKPKQHKLRRKKGSTWYNNNWNDKLENFAKYLICDDDKIVIPVGAKENIIVLSSSIKFTGRVSYINPNNIHEEDTYISTNEYIDDDEGKEFEELDGTQL